MPRLPAMALALFALLAGCDESDPRSADLPPPAALTREAVGHFCGMTLVEHPGPKGQILLRGDDRPIWFSSARDAIAFTLLDEEAKVIRAIYVSDMARAPSWEDPGGTNWVEARQAWFVVGSDRRGGMGAEEAVPFSDRMAADRFAATHRGHVLRISELPRDWVLGDVGEAAATNAPPAAASPARSGGSVPDPGRSTAPHNH